jgi:hypothetical protein
MSQYFPLNQSRPIHTLNFSQDSINPKIRFRDLSQLDIAAGVENDYREITFIDCYPRYFFRLQTFVNFVYVLKHFLCHPRSTKS